jgi:hypothetical protein
MKYEKIDICIPTGQKMVPNLDSNGLGGHGHLVLNELSYSVDLAY